MSIGLSLVLIAVGAILRFAVSIHSTVAGTSVNWNIVGDVLMIVGVIGLAISLAWVGAATRRGRPATVVEPTDRPMVP